jgi:integrase/recombinase XerD
VLEQHLPANPAVHVRRPEVDRDASTTLGLSADQARALLAAAAEHSPRMLAIVALLVDGLRISEALGLDVDDVRDIDRGHRVVALRRKGGRTAHAALPPLVADAIDTYLGHRAGTSPTDSSSSPGRRSELTGPLFVKRTGARWRPGNAARALTALVTRTGIPGASRSTPHALRHAAINLALDAGVPLHEVQDFAGRTRPSRPAGRNLGKRGRERPQAAALRAATPRIAPPQQARIHDDPSAGRRLGECATCRPDSLRRQGLRCIRELWCGNLSLKYAVYLGVQCPRAPGRVQGGNWTRKRSTPAQCRCPYA